MAGRYSGRSWICAILLTLWSPAAGAADARHPLEPPDLSSPRATLNHFLKTGDAFSRFLQERYWHAPSRAAADYIYAAEA